MTTNIEIAREKDKMNDKLANNNKKWLEEDNRIRVLKFFFDGPGKQLHIREVARQANLSPRGAQIILESLRKEGLLISESNNIVNNYRGNYSDKRFIGLKRSLNLYSLYESGLIAFLDTYYHTPECIVLFGSYSKGEDVALFSDIDITIVTDMEDRPDLVRFENLLFKTINLHLLENVKDADDSFINSLANGIVLLGYMEVV